MEKDRGDQEAYWRHHRSQEKERRESSEGTYHSAATTNTLFPLMSLSFTLLTDLFFQKIYDINLDNEMRKQMSQNNYMLSKQRYEEKKKVQDALLLQKKEEAKQAKMIKNQNEQKKFMNNERIR